MVLLSDHVSARDQRHQEMLPESINQVHRPRPQRGSARFNDRNGERRRPQDQVGRHNPRNGLAAGRSPPPRRNNRDETVRRRIPARSEQIRIYRVTVRQRPDLPEATRESSENHDQMSISQPQMEHSESESIQIVQPVMQPGSSNQQGPLHAPRRHVNDIPAGAEEVDRTQPMTFLEEIKEEPK